MASVQEIVRRRAEFDKEVRAWARLTRKDLLFKLAGLNLVGRKKLIEGEKRLQQSIRTSVRKRDGDVESVGFSFARHGIFLEHGVGRGRKRNTAAAQAARHPWLSEVLPDAQENLADRIAEAYADIIEGEIRIIVPGIELRSR